MFVKNLTLPTDLIKAEALERRIRSNHPIMADLKSFIKNLRSGYNGEKTINYYLGQIPDQRFYIFHDLRLPYGDAYFQIDALLLSSKIIFILDGKNHSGKLFIERNQMIQEFMDNRAVYENPIFQANRHKVLLNYFFNKHKIPTLPIDSFVVITKSTAEVIISPGYVEAERKVCRAGNLLGKIEEQYLRYNKDFLDNKTIKKIIKILLEKHTPLNTNIMEKFGITKFEIIPGVLCPNCLYIPMIYERKIWVCSSCNFISKDAYLNAITDYFLIVGSSFTNQELRTFLQLPSPRSTTYFISLLNFPFTCTTKGRIYHQPPDFL